MVYYYVFATITYQGWKSKRLGYVSFGTKKHITRHLGHYNGRIRATVTVGYQGLQLVVRWSTFVVAVAELDHEISVEFRVGEAIDENTRATVEESGAVMDGEVFWKDVHVSSGVVSKTVCEWQVQLWLAHWK